MFPIRSLREGTGLLAAALLMILVAVHVGGCSSDDSPVAVVAPEPPVLPDTHQLEFDFGFFDPGASLGKASGEYDNFINAYLRTAVLDVMARLVLAAPVGAFAAAAHTVPVAQPDGAWVWTYAWSSVGGPVDIVLRGLPAGDVVQWELSLVPDGADAVPWFSGETSGDGREGHFAFHDLDLPDHPLSGEINWGRVDGGTYLEFVCREPDQDGDTLRFTDARPEYAIDFTPGDGSTASYIRWIAAGSGSLQVPDYNGGQAACWGIDLRDAVCP